MQQKSNSEIHLKYVSETPLKFVFTNDLVPNIFSTFFPLSFHFPLFVSLLPFILLLDSSLEVDVVL